jgi:hypothetical protein
MHRLKAGALAILLFVAACSINDDVSGTAWDTHFTLITAPETLFVRDLADNENAGFDSDSLLLFFQDMDEMQINVGDSLRWGGTQGSFNFPLGPLEFSDLGRSDLAIPLALLFPDLAPLVGGSHEVTTIYPFDLTLDMPALPGMDWIAFSSSLFYLELENALPFGLDDLIIDVLNASDVILASVTHDGTLMPSPLLREDMPLSGLLTASTKMRLRGQNAIMGAPALIDGDLGLGLEHDFGQADSAHALIPSQSFTLSDSMLSDTRIYILDAMADNLEAHVQLENPLDVGLSFDLRFDDFILEATQETLLLALEAEATGSTGDTGFTGQNVRFIPQGEPGSDQYMQLDVSGLTNASADYRTVRAHQEFLLDVRFDELDLSHFEGIFREAQQVEIEETEEVIDAFPQELEVPHFDGIEFHLLFQNDLNLQLNTELEIFVEAASHTGLNDTLLLVSPTLWPDSDRMVVENMGALISRLPQTLRFGGSVEIPAGSYVDLHRHDILALHRVEIPARLRIISAQWESSPEGISSSMSDETEFIDLTGFIESHIPFGGQLSGEVAVDSLSNEWTSLFDIALDAAIWNESEGSTEAMLDTLMLELSDDALVVMQNSQWWIRYAFSANTGETIAEIHAEQFLRLVTRLDATIHVEAQ